MKEGEFYKEKQELIVLKQELNDFYNKKEAIYLSHKKDLENILAQIELTKQDITTIKKDNQKIKDEITGVISDKTITMYNKLKVKVVLDIFNQMVSDGNIDEVFNIIIKLKQKRVLELLKKFDIPTKTMIMSKMRSYQFKQKAKLVDRTTTMYDKMKVKVVLDIFNKMVADGKINEVFDIIVKLKEKRVLELLKKFDVETKTLIMKKMENYKLKQNTNKEDK